MMQKKNVWKWVAALTILTIGCGGCGKSGNGYDEYASAFRKVTANGGMEADFDVSLEMDGISSEADGNFKLDTSEDSNILYYELDMGDGKTVRQFSDGDYIYTEADGHKTKYALDKKPEADGESQEAKQKDSSDTVFDTEEFLKEFSSFLEAGKIKELGLLSPIEEAAVSNIEEKDGVYTFEFSDELVKNYLNILIENQVKDTEGDTLQIDKMDSFTYKAVVKDGIVTGTEYSGTIAVDVPASLMASKEEASYDMDFSVKITFVNPGEAVEIELPSTDGFEEI